MFGGPQHRKSLGKHLLLAAGGDMRRSCRAQLLFASHREHERAIGRLDICYCEVARVVLSRLLLLHVSMTAASILRQVKETATARFLLFSDASHSAKGKHARAAPAAARQQLVGGQVGDRLAAAEEEHVLGTLAAQSAGPKSPRDVFHDEERDSDVVGGPV